MRFSIKLILSGYGGVRLSFNGLRVPSGLSVKNVSAVKIEDHKKDEEDE